MSSASAVRLGSRTLMPLSTLFGSAARIRYHVRSNPHFHVAHHHHDTRGGSQHLALRRAHATWLHATAPRFVVPKFKGY